MPGVFEAIDLLTPAPPAIKGVKEALDEQGYPIQK